MNCISPIPASEPIVLDGGLESISDDPYRVQKNKERIAQSHHALGHEGCQNIEADHGNCHDDRSDDHEGTEFSEPSVCFVHERADDRVGDRVEDAHAGDHEGREYCRDPQHGIAEGGDISEDQNIVNICCAVVQREQRKLIRLGPVQRCPGLLLIIVHYVPLF